MTQPLHEVACSNCGRRYSVDITQVTQNFACPECQGVVDVARVLSSQATTPDSPPSGVATTNAPQTPATPVTPATHATPVTSPTSVTPPPSAGSTTPVVDSPKPSVAQARAANRSGPISILVVAFLFLAGIAAIACFALYMSKKVGDREAAGRKENKKVVAPKNDPTVVNRSKVNWATAGDKSVNFGNFRIRITRVEYSPIRARDGAGNFQSSGDTPYLKVFFEIRNKGLAADYTTWYQVYPEGSPEPRLLDEDKNRLFMIVFENAGSMQAHTPKATVDQDDEITDLLVFEVPEDTTIDEVGTLYLSLPGSAFGVGGALHFKIPQDKIHASGKPVEGSLQSSPLGG